MLIGNCYVRDLRDRLRALATEARAGPDYARRPAESIKRVVVHHTAGAHQDHTAESIARYHVQTNGWPGIGYHFLVHWDGRLEYVGDLLTVRYHCGRLNGTSIGLCLVGCFTNGRRPTSAQLVRARMLLAGLREAVRPDLAVVGHRDVSALSGYGPTECPGDWWTPGALETEGWATSRREKG